MKVLDSIALALLIVGGLNWLLVGLFAFDLFALPFVSFFICCIISVNSELKNLDK